MADIKLKIHDDPREEANGSIITLSVPAGKESDDNYISKALQDHLDAKYGPVNPVHAPDSSKVIKPNVGINDPNFGTRVASRIAATSPDSSDTGIVAGLKRGVSGLVSPFTNPKDTIKSLASKVVMSKGYDPKTDQQMTDADIAENKGNTVSRIVSGDVSGAIAEQLPAIAAGTSVGAMGESPKVRAFTKGTTKGVGKSLTQPSSHFHGIPVPPAIAAGGVGSAAGYYMGGHPLSMILGPIAGGATALAQGVGEGMAASKDVPWVSRTSIPPTPIPLGELLARQMRADIPPNQPVNAQFVYPDEAEYYHSQPYTAESDKMQSPLGGDRFQYYKDAEYQDIPRSGMPAGARSMPPGPPEYMPKVEAIEGYQSPVQFQGLNIPPTSPYTPQQYPRVLPPGVGERSGQAIPLAPSTTYPINSPFNKVRKSFYSNPEPQTDVKMPAPKDDAPEEMGKVTEVPKKSTTKDVINKVNAKKVKAPEEEPKVGPKNPSKWGIKKKPNTSS